MDVSSYVDQAVQYLRDGFANINNPRGLLIALVGTIFMGSWRQWIPIALVAVVVVAAPERGGCAVTGDDDPDAADGGFQGHVRSSRRSFSMSVVRLRCSRSAACRLLPPVCTSARLIIACS